MKNNQLFQKQQPKLTREAVMRSLLSGLAVGFGANFLASLITWFLPINGLWISLAALVAVTLIAAPLFYFKRFRTNDMMNARRIDRLGLDERMITMVELEDSDSYIAKVQREDAQAALAAVDAKQLRLRISKAIILSVLICAILGAGMTIVNFLSENGVLPGGDQLLDDFVEQQTTVYVKITYEAEDGGIIEGDEAQVLVQGTDASTITAVADDGYVFKCWNDGSTNPTRTDTNVQEDVTYTATFTPLEEDGEGEEEGKGDFPTDAPGSQGDGDGDGNDDDPKDPSDQDDISGGGGAWEPNNQIINGETFYRDVLQEYQDAAEELLKDPDNGLTDEEKELIKKYLGIV